ncbi:MAG: D-sedoheptulose 7-phosphate isomerase [Acidobacteriota bacterium]|nr:D-sedoheptulose 7-phosphate isomerase [Acidobacteriota bacterium]
MRPAPGNEFSIAIADHLAVVDALHAQCADLQSIADCMTNALCNGNKILWCGNGGSAADAQHLAAELVGRFRRERRGMAGVALTTDTSILTAVANDYGYDTIFERQVEAIGSAGDVLVGISTSGNSLNIANAIEKASAMGLWTVAFTGRGGGRIARIAHYVLAVASSDTARIQEVHILAGHLLCDWVEQHVPVFLETHALPAIAAIKG